MTRRTLSTLPAPGEPGLSSALHIRHVGLLAASHRSGRGSEPPCAAPSLQVDSPPRWLANRSSRAPCDSIIQWLMERRTLQGRRWQLESYRGQASSRKNASPRVPPSTISLLQPKRPQRDRRKAEDSTRSRCVAPAEASLTPRSLAEGAPHLVRAPSSPAEADLGGALPRRSTSRSF